MLGLDEFICNIIDALKLKFIPYFVIFFPGNRSTASSRRTRVAIFSGRR
jgi:hypothetical protein